MIDALTVTDLLFAVTAGVATFFSPCAFPLLPGYVGFYVNSVGDETPTLSGATARGAAAGVGVLATFALLMGATTWIGYSTLSNITVFEYLVGALLIVGGLVVATGYAPSLSIPLPKRRTGVLGFGVFGAGYALAGAGCVNALFIAVIARAIVLPPAEAVAVLGTYAAVVSALMVSVTVATGMGILSRASKLTAYSGLLKRLAGVVMILAGAGQLFLAYYVY